MKEFEYNRTYPRSKVLSNHCFSPLIFSRRSKEIDFIIRFNFLLFNDRDLRSDYGVCFFMAVRTNPL